MLYTYKLLCPLMARKTRPNETITVQLHNKHVFVGKSARDILVRGHRWPHHIRFIFCLLQVAS